MPVVLRRGAPKGGAGVTSACTSASSARVPSITATTAEPGHAELPFIEKGGGGVGHFRQAALVHGEDAQFVRGAEAIFHRAQDAIS